MTIRKKIFVIIKNNLTIGRVDRDLEPYTEIEIRHFIIENLNNIERVIWKMICDYKEKEEYELEPNMIYEYLTDFITTN